MLPFWIFLRSCDPDDSIEKRNYHFHSARRHSHQEHALYSQANAKIKGIS